ncbi:MAG: helix-turn-helix transcriptional regulator [Gordonia sp.]|jgi:DNA-binding CsgD family transcriptional regulator|uniref:response regulator transcription factor n=1 Tax=Gordonia sp. (in: high G+C Gram-positive bacteria) TaxID=84139 RepID=UPI000C4FC7B5|nr:LuxR C-terminal-related transcriptional regulator [Gordonia sp. (in: high G+C Gram-positive bacteria)]MAU82312.1 helix-turn-helix transcriptional regulator [Gordonia sp. (in: high G+C Gram-positive bacteria)]MAU84457.1 helix-turn-helix transcriptional regulator [Gordonia sp. (in: high G+C Gram-positive bacteria)]
MTAHSHTPYPGRSTPARPAGPDDVAQPAAVGLNARVTRLSDYRQAEGAMPDPRRPELSSREVEVLLAWLAAESKEEAATALFISASTVSTHLARIRAKYSGVGREAPTKAHLLARALQDGYTSLDSW